MSSPWALVTQPHLLLQNRLSLWATQRVCLLLMRLADWCTLIYTPNSHTHSNIQTRCMLTKRKKGRKKNLHTHTVSACLPTSKPFPQVTPTHQLPNDILTLMWGRVGGQCYLEEKLRFCAHFWCLEGMLNRTSSPCLRSCGFLACGHAVGSCLHVWPEWEVANPFMQWWSRRPYAGRGQLNKQG